MLVDADRFDELPDELLEDMAEAMDLSADEVASVMSQVDVMVVGADGSNINLTSIPLADEIPTPQLLRAQFRLFNATVSDVEDIETPVGRGRIARYAIDLPGGRQHGAGIFVRLSTGVANLTITSGDTDLVESLIDKVVPTLDETGAPGEA